MTSVLHWLQHFVLPCVSVGVGETIEPLEEDKKITGRDVLLVKGYEVLDSLST